MDSNDNTIQNAEVVPVPKLGKHYEEFRIRMWKEAGKTQPHIQSAYRGDRNRLDKNGLLDLARVVLAIANATGNTDKQYLLMETEEPSNDNVEG